MKQHKLYILLLVSCFLLGTVTAQNYRVFRKNSFFLGVLGGANFTTSSVVKKYNALSFLEGEKQEGFEKDYMGMFKNSGSQFGLHFMYGMTRNWSLILQPSYFTQRFNYINAYAWEDTLNFMDFSREFRHVQKVSYISIPLAVRYDFTTTQFSPYVQAGLFFDLRSKATKSVYYDNVIDGEVDLQKAMGTSTNVLISDQFKKFNVGVTAGVGFTCFFNYFSIGLEANYRFGLMNVMNDANRYLDENGMTIQYLDVMDQMRLGQLNVQMHLVFSLDNSQDLDILRRSRY